MVSTAGGSDGRVVSPRVMAVLEAIRTGAPISEVEAMERCENLSYAQ